MFEAVILVCLELATGPCRDQLLPGYEAAEKSGCEQKLQTFVAENSAAAKPVCRAVGDTLPMQQVADGIFAHAGLIEEPDMHNHGDVSNLGFIIGDDSVAVIDTGSARWMGEALWRSIRAQTDKPVTHVILTHLHPDHVFGASPFVETGARIVGHEHLKRHLADRVDNYMESLDRLIGADMFIGTTHPDVDMAVKDAATIDLGNRVLELHAWPTAHSGSDLTVLDRRTATLFAGDLVFHQHTPALDGQLIGWQRVLGDLITIEAARVVPGHGAAVLDWPEAATDLRRYLKVLETDTRSAIKRGERLGDAIHQIARSEAAHWELFEEYNPRNATVAFTELEWE